MLVNLTGKKIEILIDGGCLVLPPSGEATIERVDEVDHYVGGCDACAHYGGYCGAHCAGEGVPVYRTTSTILRGIPPYEYGAETIYIVSPEFAEVCERGDCIAYRLGKLYRPWDHRGMDRDPRDF